MSLSADELEMIVVRMLEEGVPPSVAARIFGLEPELVRDVQSRVRIAHYGTEDLVEYVEQMQWEAVDKARKTLAEGSPTEQARLTQLLLAKQMTLAARRTPEGTRKARDDLLDTLAAMRDGSKVAAPPFEADKFVATVMEGEDG